jgi:lysophospholipase L1-like esterase
MRIIGTGLVLILVVVIAGAAFLGYELNGAYQAIRDPASAPPVPTTRVEGRDVVVFTTISSDKLPAAIKDAQGKVDQNVGSRQAFTLELSGTDLMALISARAGDSARALPIAHANLAVHPEAIGLTADLRGTVPVPVAGTLTPSVSEGRLELAVSSMRIGLLPVPADQLVGPLINQALDINAALAASGAMTLQSVELRDGTMRLVGLQRDGALIEQGVAQRIKEQVARPANSAPTVVNVAGADVVPAGSTLGKPGNPIYLAVGDSLAAGVGVTDKREDFVSRFHAYLEKQTGQQLGLTNLGISGESTSTMLTAGQLQKALATIKADPKGVRVLTLGIGANDLLGHVASPACQTDPTGIECQSRLRAALTAFPPNFKRITSQLASAIDPSTQVIVMNVYNPFNFGIGVPAEQMSNQTVKSLNDAIAAEAKAHGWQVADAGGAIGDRAAALTSILNGDVHPTALGYQAIAYAFTQVYKKP